jgi:uncharacterized protein (DUF362 family)
MHSSLVSIQPCNNYQLENIRVSLAACLAPLGGIEAFVKPGIKVLIKPNLLTAAAPEKAVTTHPAVIQCVAEIVSAYGGIVWIGDSPAAEMNDGKSVWESSGVSEAISVTDGKLVKFKGAYLRRLNGADYYISRPVLDADLVINLPN